MQTSLETDKPSTRSHGDAGVAANRSAADRVELVLDQLDQLPTLPVVAIRLIALTSGKTASARDVIELVESDPSLTTKIISLTQKAAIGVRPENATIDKAVVLLGFSAIRSLALSIKVFEIFGPSDDVENRAFDRTEFWKHSLAVACAAQLIAAESDGPVEPEEAFVCGLVHDIGKVALDQCLPKSFDRAIRLCRANRACIAEVEHQVIGVDHTVAGRRLAQRWGLPEILVNCIWLHHHRGEILPESVAHRPYIEVVHLADLIAREHRIGYSGNYAFPERAVDVAQRMGLNARAFARIEAELAEHIERRAGIIGLNQLTSDRLYLSALTTANEELGQLNSALSQSNASLRIRSRFFEALRHLGTTAGANASLRDVSCAAAGAVAIATESPRVLVFIDGPRKGTWQVAVHTGDSPPFSELVRSDAESTAPSWSTHSPLAGRIVPAESRTDHLPRELLNRLGEPPYWTMSLVHGDRHLGGAIFAATPGQAQRLGHTGEELGALAGAIGLEVADAEIRTAAMRLNEELAAANLRMQNAETELLRARSLSMISEMASGAAHELNNPLAVISGRSQLLYEKVKDESARKTLDLIRQQARRCSKVVSELAEFARPASPKPERVDLATLLAEIRTSLQEEKALTVEPFVVTVGADAETIWADREQLRIIIGELIRNGLDAAGDTPVELRVNCHQVVTDERIVVEVVDRGRGMKPDVLRRAFDPFFSHRPAGRGRGLGLSRAHRLAEINGGKLWLESRESVGTTAFLSLPKRGDQ